MAPLNTSTREPARTPGPDAYKPAVLNVRRPNATFAGADQPAVKPHADLRMFNEAAQPRTVLRLPDLAAAVQRMRRTEFNLAAIAQWVALGLGGLLALWLIFGGRRPPVSTSDEAPPWSSPGAAQVEMAPPTAATEAAAPAPQWQSSSWEAAPAQAEPYSGGPPAAGSNGESAPAAPNWNDPNWNDSVKASAPPPTGVPQQPGMRTAQRYETNNGPLPSHTQPPQVQPLDVTVPVRQ